MGRSDYEIFLLLYIYFFLQIFEYPSMHLLFSAAG